VAEEVPEHGAPTTHAQVQKEPEKEASRMQEPHACEEQCGRPRQKKNGRKQGHRAIWRPRSAEEERPAELEK
jgi:hypothetical protein